MKCKGCNKKVFRNIGDSGWRMCVNCNTIHPPFEYRKYKFKRGVFEYDNEN